jgi:hypothetical protein
VAQAHGWRVWVGEALPVLLPQHNANATTAATRATAPHLHHVPGVLSASTVPADDFCSAATRKGEGARVVVGSAGDRGTGACDCDDEEAEEEAVVVDEHRLPVSALS